MAELQERTPGTVWLGHRKEARKSYRRKTLARVSDLTGPFSDSEALVMDLSLDGVYLRTKDHPPVGERIGMNVYLPSGAKRPIHIAGQIVRNDERGLGLRFEELQSRDRAKIRHYSAFVELDEAIVELQNKLKGTVSGNLLPVSEWRLIEERLLAASERRLPVRVVYSLRTGQFAEGELQYQNCELRLQHLKTALPEGTRVVYCIVDDGPLHSVFEGLILEKGINPLLVLPERMYHNERRWSRREAVTNTWMVVEAPHLEKRELRLSVNDLSEGGCSVMAHRDAALTVGMRFPAFQLLNHGRVYNHDGATITRVTPQPPEGWLLGLNFLDQSQDRDAFAEIKDRSLRSNFWTSLQRVTGMARDKITRMVGGKADATRERLHLAHYKNTRGDMVAALLDATFDLNGDAPPVDVAVVIGPPFPVRKEVFSLLARTLIDNFAAQGLQAVVCRFDLTHALGESEVNPEMEAKGHPYLRWTYSHLESDMIGSFSYLERRFRPRKRVVVAYSVAAIAARRMVADGNKPPVDLFIAPFGCPDGQDMFKNLLAGVDLFPIYLRGEKAEPFLIYGRLSDPSGVLPDAIKRGMAFLEDARKDMSKITVPVVWIVGTYDFMVTRSRVRQMLNAPGGGPREIIEVATGHNPKIGSEAIESFKIISESISKHLFNNARPAIEPDLVRAQRQYEIEWARTKRKKFVNAAEYWNRHLFGTEKSKEGYDVLLYNPDYVEFIEMQVDLLDVQPGHRVADIGCGTGNLSVKLLEKNAFKALDLNCLDLVPNAVDCTRGKIQAMIANPDGSCRNVNLHCRVVDLEAARLTCWQEFLSGQLHGVGAVIGRIEGLNAPAIRKIEQHYGPEIHRILRGEKATVSDVRRLVTELDETEAELVLELSMASRFLLGRTLPDDLRPGVTVAATAADLRFQHLHFGQASPTCRIDCPDGAFDRIGGSLILPYLYDPGAVLRELRRMLAPGGVLVLSSLKPNFDSSKSYLEEAETISKRKDLTDLERERLLASLREFSAFVASIMEMEDEGRFRFFAADEFASLVRDAGFVNVQTAESFGKPPTAVIVRAEKGR